MQPAPCLLWFRRDLRLSDHPALAAALASGRAIVPIFIWPPDEGDGRTLGEASRVWLGLSLAALDGDLRRRGSRLIVRSGRVVEELGRLLAETGAGAIYWERVPEPAAARLDESVRRDLAPTNVELHDFPGNLLFEPDELRTKAGGSFKVFTPFYREAMRHLSLEPALSLPPAGSPRRGSSAQAHAYLAEPRAGRAASTFRPSRGRRSLPARSRWPRTLRLDGAGPLTEEGAGPARVDPAGIRDAWDVGERAARKRLASFVDDRVDDYDRLHDRTDLDATSRLSAHLHFGEISVHEVWQAVAGRLSARRAEGGRSLRASRPAGADGYLRQILWREFAHHVLAHFPELPGRPLRPQFGRLPWTRPGRRLDAWREGRTGYPIVDAAMRQLRQTGWMHNRARLITGSFLVKDLLIRWQEGERWFWETLVDGDLANNAFNWQWVAGCGADPAPFFRIFNPTLQGRKFDPRGAYVRRYVPELARLADRHIHEPWAAPASELKAAGIRLGSDYPRPIVDHAEARDRALMALAEIGRPGG